MELILKRIAKKNDYTIGKLFIGEEYFCDTLEPTWRNLLGVELPPEMVSRHLGRNSGGEGSQGTREDGDTRRSLPSRHHEVDPLQEVAAAAPRRAWFLRCSHPRWKYRQGHARLHPRG